MPAIDALVTQINRKMKFEALVPGKALQHLSWQRCPTGSLAFDVMLGGGWPLNCWNEIIGIESSGKTTMALKTIAACQAADPNHHTLWVAAEDFDPPWAQSLGVDIDRITFVMTNVMEYVYDTILQVVGERAVDAVVLDSYPALVPSDEEDKSMIELTVGRGAYFTNKFMRKAFQSGRRSLTETDRPFLGLFVNQWRERIGVLGHADPRTTPGGKGKNYTFLTRVEVAREEWITDSAKLKVGQVIKARTVKNKTAPPQRTASVRFYFDDHKYHHKGDYDWIPQLQAIAIERGIIEQSGSWFSFGEEKWQGMDKVLAALATNPLLAETITTEVRHRVLGEPLPQPPDKRKRRIVTT